MTQSTIITVSLLYIKQAIPINIKQFKLKHIIISEPSLQAVTQSTISRYQYIDIYNRIYLLLHIVQ